MKNKLAWLISAILLLVHLGIQYFYYVKTDFSDPIGIAEFFVDLSGNLLLILIVGSIISLLMSLIPYKARTFKDKFRSALPIGMVIILAALIVVFSISILSAKKAKTKYADLKIPPGLNCQALHEGRFETDRLVIERAGNRQIQTNKSTKKKKEFRLEWLSDCEYMLRGENINEKLMVKIVSVNESSYECFVLPERPSSGHSSRQIIRILK